MPERHFWNARKSTTLSIVVTCLALALAVTCIPFLLPLIRLTTPSSPGPGPTDYSRSVEYPGSYGPVDPVSLAIPLYACLLWGIVALIILLTLLRDIRRDEVFTLNNVRRLRLISYCGFLIMATCIVAVFTAPMPVLFAIIAALAGFLGLLMRVIKNVIDAARLLKEDADYTI